MHDSDRQRNNPLHKWVLRKIKALAHCAHQTAITVPYMYANILATRPTSFLKRVLVERVLYGIEKTSIIRVVGFIIVVVVVM
jgi:hypothetical protein